MTARPNLLAAEDLPSEPRQKRSQDKRACLKIAALALFGEKGYEATSVDEIARRAGMAVGGFYQHYRSKRQLLLALMDELLEGLSRLDIRPKTDAPNINNDVRGALHAMLSRAFAADIQYLGAYRAWQEAALADPDLTRKQEEIQAWTTARVRNLFHLLLQLPGARPDVDVPALASAMDSFFWNLLAQAVRMPRVELNQWIDAATHLIYHALFLDSAGNAG